MNKCTDWVACSGGTANVIYYESHINLKYVDSVASPQTHNLLKSIAKAHRFKLSNMNGNDGHPDEETQTILTTHTQDHREMVTRMMDLLVVLKANGIEILRYKIEAATIDSRKKDEWRMLG